VITFPKELQINTLEATLQEINQSPSDLMIPIAAKSSYFGGLSSAIQCINTWVRFCSDKKLIFKESIKPFDEQLKNIVNQQYKFSGALMAKSITLSNANEERDIKSELHRVAKTHIEQQSRESHGFHRGNICSFSFVDHSTKGFDKNFYLQTNLPKQPPRKDDQIENIIRDMIDKTFYTAGGAAPLPDSDYELIGRIFTELFKNTHEHGSRDLDREKWLKPAVRTIYTKTLNLGEVAAQNMVAGADVLASYIASLSDHNIERRRYLELGIVDSGLGFYQRWQADHSGESLAELPNIKQEYEIFEKCFSFRSTSSSEDHKGMGLPTVMERLTELKGFMKVRSGRLSLYRDFNSQPYQLNGDCVFYDWNTMQPGTLNPTAMSNTAGVSITLLVPLGDKS
jgi:hypothetical protein